MVRGGSPGNAGIGSTVYGHLATEPSRHQEVYSPPHNTSVITDTVYLPGIVTFSSSPNIN